MPKLNMPKLKLSPGFTLIEGMIAMVIFAVVVLALTALLYAIIQGNRDTNLYTTLVTLATDRLERIQVQSLNSDAVSFGAIGNEGPTTVNAQGIADAAGKFIRQVFVNDFDLGTPGNVDYKEVEVRVTSQETGRVVSLQTIVAPPVAS